MSHSIAAPTQRTRPSAPFAPLASVRSGLWASRQAATLVAFGLASVYAVAISWLAVTQHATFHTRARDMGIYAQVLWNGGHGRPFASTLLADNASHLAEHVAPPLALLAPLYALAPDPRLLLVVQQLCLALSGLPIFFFARERLGVCARAHGSARYGQRLGELAALALLAGYYAAPAMSRIALSEFHPIKMAALPMALGIKAVLDGRIRPAVAWLILALLFEEETAPLVGAAGAYLLLVHRRRAGFALGALAVAWLLAAVLVVMPAFHARERAARADDNRTAAHFDQVRQDPSVALGWLAGERGIEAAAWLLLPAVGLPLLAPGVLAIAGPAFAVLFLQDREGTFAGHWSGAMQPVLWFAAAAGLARLAARAGPRRAAVVAAALGVLLLASGLAYTRFSHFPGGRGHDDDRFVWTEHEADLARAVALAPPNVRLDATRRIVPHLAHRPEVYQFPSTFYSAPMRPDLARIDAFLLDLTDSPTRRALDATDQDTVLTKRPRLHVRAFGDDILLLTRERPSPDRPADARFGQALRLIGYDLERGPEHLRLTPYWEPTARLDAWTRVAELVAADGRPIARDATAPLDPYLPPARWDRGQVIAETIDLPFGASPAPGPYRLHLSWQDQSGRPIPLADGTARLELAVESRP